jgi:hypothetical protein
MSCGAVKVRDARPEIPAVFETGQSFLEPMPIGEAADALK